MDSTLIDLLFGVGGAVIAFLVGAGILGLKKRPDYDKIEFIVTKLVEAAQQMSRLSNEEKYDYVVAHLSAWLKSQGWNISPDLIEVFIESAVRLLRREEKSLGVSDLLDGSVDDEEELE
jgi:hypothetical protein